ncbi:MAG: MDR/zinc-dependent alcohol dehydrogenase-like family protein [Anaerolineales bacterium]
MKAIWLEDQQLSVRDNLPIPNLKENEALIQVRLAGICATDLELVKGYYPYTGIPGHEFVGTVVEARRAKELIGKRVVGEINIACGTCRECVSGNPHHCLNRAVLGIVNHHGAFAEYLTLPIENLHLVEEIIPDEDAVFTEPLAAAIEILEQISIKPTDKVLLIGSGRLGLLIAQVVNSVACNFQALAKYPHQQQLLHKWNVAFIPSPDQIEEKSYDIVIEATGSPQGYQLARQAVRPRKTIVLKSTYHGNMEVNMSSVVVDEVTLVGSRCGPFQPALELLKQKRVDVHSMIMDRYPIARGVEAFQKAAQPGVLKVLLQP